MVKENRLASEKNNKEHGLTEEFRKNFKRQLEIYRKRKQIQEGEKYTLSKVKADMVEEIGVDIKTIGNWNTRGMPTIDNIIEIAKFFGCSIDELLTGRNPYSEVTKQLESDGVTEEFILNLEVLLREMPNTKDLFGQEISKPKWNTRKYTIDSFSNPELMHKLGYYHKISNACFSLTKKDKKVCREKMESLNGENPETALNLLIPKFPVDEQKILIENIANIDSFDRLSRAKDILKIIKDEVSENK